MAEPSSRLRSDRLSQRSLRSPISAAKCVRSLLQAPLMIAPPVVALAWLQFFGPSSTISSGSRAHSDDPTPSARRNACRSSPARHHPHGARRLGAVHIERLRLSRGLVSRTSARTMPGGNERAYRCEPTNPEHPVISVGATRSGSSMKLSTTIAWVRKLLARLRQSNAGAYQRSRVGGRQVGTAIRGARNRRIIRTAVSRPR